MVAASGTARVAKKAPDYAEGPERACGGLDDTVLHHSIEISTEYPEHLFIDVEYHRNWS